MALSHTTRGECPAHSVDSQLGLRELGVPPRKGVALASHGHNWATCSPPQVSPNLGTCRPRLNPSAAECHVVHGARLLPHARDPKARLSGSHSLGTRPHTRDVLGAGQLRGTPGWHGL